MLFLYSFSCVNNFNVQEALFSLKPHSHGNSTHKSKFNRVRNEVNNNLHEPLIISKHPRWHIAVKFNNTVNVFDMGFELHHFININKQLS
jgi:hypothetical protein